MPTFNQPKTLADLLIVEVSPNWTTQRLSGDALAALAAATA